MKTVRDMNLRRPQLDLVIAEDHEEWCKKLQGLGEELDQWPFARLSHFDLSVHGCRTVEGFERLVGGLLSEGSLVYATLDLNMPVKEGDNAPVPQAGEKMIHSCLRWKRQGYPLEFCLISELDEFLEKLHGDSSELRKLGIRKIHKSEILKDGGSKYLEDVAVDIQRFVRRNLNFSTVESPPGSGERAPIWFGGREPLHDLLSRADQIGGAEDAGVYLLFAEAGGYEVDWVALCCELRGLELTMLDIAKADSEYSLQWKHPFKNPPEALLVRNLDQANDKRCDIAPLLNDGFFEKVSKEKALVFFHFPLFETHLDVSKLDDAIEIPILERCLSHIHKYHPVRPLQQGVSVLLEHPRIITFPSYGALRTAGVIQKTVELQAQESRRQHGCENVVIDPEIFELLIEIPWNEKGGFPQLRNAIKGAYESFSAERAEGDFVVREHHFRNHAVVSEESKGALGFLARGRRLYRLLETRDQSLVNGEAMGEKSSEAEQRLVSLEILWQLYDGLHRLRELRDTLGHQPSTDGFTPQHYETLSRARNFLDSLFDSPASLRRLIDIFRSKMGRKVWRQYYPALSDSRLAVVENIEFTWPFSHLPLHPSVFDYLQNNGVSPLIQDEIEDNLQRFHPDLQAQWETVKSERSRLRAEWLRREEERRVAIRFVQEDHSQPVLVHLAPRVKADEQPPPFRKILTAFILFNSHLALAENYYVFRERKLVSQNVLKEALERVELGPMATFLSQYAAALVKDKVGSRSLFHRWTDRWAEGKQPDAVRLARQVAAHMLNAPKYKRGWSKYEKNVLRQITGEESIRDGGGIEAILGFFRIIRNAYLKATGADFEQEYARDLRDLMRRFVFATTGSYRLGRAAGENRIELWRKDAGEQSEPAELVGDSGRWQGRLVVARPSSDTDEAVAYEALFPIDDLIRLRPCEDSIWAYYSKEIWINLTYTEGPEEERLSPSEEDEEAWLPSQQQFKSSELWESVHDE